MVLSVNKQNNVLNARVGLLMMFSQLGFNRHIFFPLAFSIFVVVKGEKRKGNLKK